MWYLYFLIGFIYSSVLTYLRRKDRHILDKKELTQKKIGFKFGVANIIISRIKHNKLWSHI